MSMMEISTKLRWTSYSQNAMGHGFVGFNLTAAEKLKGCYDPHTMFIHKDLIDPNGEYRQKYSRPTEPGGWPETINPELEAQIEKDCFELARLLDKFLIGHDYWQDPDPEGRKADGQTARKE